MRNIIEMNQLVKICSPKVRKGVHPWNGYLIDEVRPNLDKPEITNIK